jgi:hypothetical protein
VSALRAFVRYFLGKKPSARMLDGFVDSLVQTFENCRPGLSDAAVSEKGSAVEGYFLGFYEKERSRLHELVEVSYSHMSEGDRQALESKIDERIKNVLIPAYARVARRFTVRERNDFYHSKEGWHGAERIAFGLGGILLAFLMMILRFIPLTAREVVALLALGGLFYPELRRVFAWKGFESQLNQLVERTDDEIFRMDLALLTREVPPKAVGASLPAPPVETSVKNPPGRAREGGR